MKLRIPVFMLLLIIVLALAGCGGRSAQASTASAQFTLKTGIVDGRMAFLGVGGQFDGMVNPDLVVRPGESVSISLVNGDGLTHDLSIPDLHLKTSPLSGKDAVVELDFTAPAGAGARLLYFCTMAGHRMAGMEGEVIVAAAG